MNSRSSGAVVVFLLGVVVLAAASGAMLATGDAYAMNEEAENETTETEVPPHEHPDGADGDGDDDQVAAYLSSELARLLGDSTLEISEGEYEMGREHLGEEYDDILGKYLEVAQDTGEEETAEEFEETRNEQEELSEKLEEFQETREAYEEAVEAGDEEQARELARELLVLADDIETLIESLDSRYENIENLTMVDFEELRQLLANTNEETRNVTESISEEEFVETTLSVSADAETMSFTEPVTLTGQIATSEGEPVANKTVRLDVGEQSHVVSTNETGEFSLTYRPVAIPLNGTTLSVAYRPANASLYLPSADEVSISVSEQTNSSVTIDSASEVLAYGDRAQASGSVTIAENETIGGVPVELRVDGRILATGVTDGDGRFDLEGQVPASIEAGDQSLTVAVALNDAAVAASERATTMTVDSTATTMDIEIDPSVGEPADMQITGSLDTVTGLTVPGQSVALFVGGERVATVQTDSDGRFSETIRVPADRHDAEEVTVSAQFDGDGTNLDSTSTDESARLPDALGASAVTEPAEPSILERIVGESPFDLLGTILVVGLLGATTVLLALPRFSVAEWPIVGSLVGSIVGRPAPERTASASSQSTESPSSPAPTGSAPNADRPHPLVERARTALTDGRPAAAVEAAYAAVRSNYRETAEADIKASPAATHWEFYAACREAGIGDDERLETLTQTFERATFSTKGVSTSEAEQAITIAEGRF